MTVYILGGSNSLISEGWATWLAKAVPDQKIVNRAIGSTTTLMGLYRFLTTQPPQPGDVVVWEYALNEVNHILHGYRAEVMHEYLEHLIRLCSDRQLRFVAAVFTPLRQELAPVRSPYYDGLLHLLDHYGIARFDVSPAWRTANGKAHMPGYLYEIPPHYKRVPDLMQFIAEGVAGAIRQARVPADVPALRTGDRSVELRVLGGETSFANALMTVQLAPVPARVTFERDGRLLGLYVLARPDGINALRLDHERRNVSGQWLRLSTTSEAEFPKPLIKAVSMATATGAHWAVSAGDTLHIRPAAQGGRFHAEYQMVAELGQPDRVQRPAAIAMLMETG